MNNDINFGKRLFAMFGYLIPIFGWWLPLYITRKDRVMQYHGKQSFIITFAFLINGAFIYLISRIIPLQFDFIMKITWLTFLGIYALVLITAILKTLFFKKINMPLFGKIVEKLPL